MQCSKDFAIGVNEGFLWNGQILGPGTGGTASFTPLDGQTGNTATAVVTIPDASDASSAQGFGDFTWNSTAIQPCNLHIEIISTGTLPDPDMIWTVQIFNGGVLVNEDQTTLGVSGNFDIPFNLPNTGGVDTTITWTMLTVISNNPALGGSLSVQAILTFV